MARRRLILPLLLTSTLWAGSVLAHHCIRAEYDEAQLVEYSVTVEKVSWVNPHVIFSGKVVQQNGATVMWDFETINPGSLQRAGFARDQVKPGDRLKIDAYRSRIGASKGEVLRITFADGHKFEPQFSWDGWCSEQQLQVIRSTH